MADFVLRGVARDAAEDRESVVDGYHDELKKRKVRITDPLTTQWWGDRTFKVLDPNGYEIWFYETTSEPKPPEGTKIV